MNSFSLVCITCKREFSPDEVLYTCPECGTRKGTLEVRYKMPRQKHCRPEDLFQAIGRRDMWRYWPLLPFKSVEADFSPLEVGPSPTISCDKLAKKLGMSRLFLKDDGRNPSASLKDRASNVAVAKALELGFSNIYCASTGNAASSLSCISAAAGLNCYIFVPAATPEAKLSQMLVFGSRVLRIDASYDEVFDLSMSIGEEKGWYCRNSAINPYLLEGKKTATFELFEALNWNVPDYILVSAGDGTILSSVYKAIMDLLDYGLISRSPVVLGVQGENSSAIADTYDSGFPFEPIDQTTQCVADSINVGKPRDVIKACSYTKQNGGGFIRVSDDEIVAAIYTLARTCGIFSEPAGAAALAGLEKALADGIIGRKASVALLITGNGLKDIRPVAALCKESKVLPPDEKLIKEELK
ncbi:MAG: Threonine synthase [Thermotogales bacterium 46_20]|nr:MAG: Threonine synthase [Thermotogales bacterium 46_20]